MKYCAVKVLLICTFALLNTGCNKHFVNTHPVSINDSETNITRRFNHNTPVSIKNIQPTAEIKIWGAGTHEYTVNAVQWTDTAVEILSLQLAQYGVSIQSDADKYLALSITEPDFSFWTQGKTGTIKVKVNVKAGNGYQATYQGIGKKEPPFGPDEMNAFDMADVNFYRAGSQIYKSIGSTKKAQMYDNLAMERQLLVKKRQNDQNTVGYYDKWEIQLRVKANEALAVAVRAILNDKAIINYLQK